MHLTPKLPRRLATLTILGALLSACQATPTESPWPVPNAPWGDLDDDVSPSLEQIFLDPPLTGTAPRVVAISSDGLWLLTRWGETPEDSEDGKPGADVRLVESTGGGPSNGNPINECLGLEGEELNARGPWTWSFEGSHLAIARGRRIYLFDPNKNQRQLLLEGPRAPEPEEPAEMSEAAVDEAPIEPRDEASAFDIQSLAFAPDGQTLRAFINDELYVFPLPQSNEAKVLELADGKCLSAGFLSKPSFDWSSDLKRVFNNNPYPMPPRAEEDGEESSPRSVTQVWHVDEKRGVALEGMQELEWLESSSLSPDGRFVFGVSYDRRAEPERTLVPNYLSERVSMQATRRLLAEDGPSYFDLFVWDTDSGKRQSLLPAELQRDWDAAAPEAHENQRQEGHFWLRNIGWAPQKTADAVPRYAYELLSADYRKLEIWVWSAGESQLLWRDEDERWLGGPARYSRWSADGQRLLVGSEWGTPLARLQADKASDQQFTSSTPGRSQLFSVNPVTRESRQLTHFAGEMTRFFTLPDGGAVVTGSQANAAQRVVGVLSPGEVRSDTPTGPRFADLPPGWNASVRSSSDGSRLVFSHSELMQPAELWVSDAQATHPITAATPTSFHAFDWIKPERLQVQAPDGSTVWAHVYLPKGVELASPSGPPRATIVFVHGAGYLQNVTDSMTRYEPNMLFHSRLAQMGYPVVDVDYRGSSGYGSHFRSDVQYHLGGLDLDDIHLVLDELVQRGLVDARRVGLYGGSYGGFMAMMALFTAPERWSVGAALRSVTDWRTYHPTYTQPRLGRPSTHPEAYAKSSPIDLYEGLEDPLLILHGMRDDNVFAQDSIRLMEALIDQGSDFEAMLYPSQRHGFSDGNHWLDEYRRIERFLLRHLGAPIPTE